MSLKSEATRISKQLIGAAIVMIIVALFLWWRYGDISPALVEDTPSDFGQPGAAP